MNNQKGLVYLLDDEPEMVKALTRLLRGKGFEVRGFTSVREFLAGLDPRVLACLVLDVTMPELDGLELQRQLLGQGIRIPIIFLTAHGDIPMSVRAIKDGASEFLTKPVEGNKLAEAVSTALQEAEKHWAESAETATWASRLATLTRRESEVMQHVVAGRLNKQIADELGTGEQNIKFHRAHIMKKMGVESVADLVRIVERLRPRR